MNRNANANVVLVVDDEMFARLFAVQIFLDEGFTVLEAADAEEGLSVLDRNEDVGLLFTDINMPGALDGLQLAQRVRQVRPDIALVTTSGCAVPLGEALPSGSRFIPKPYTAHALMTAIRAVVSDAAPAHAAGLQEQVG